MKPLDGILLKLANLIQQGRFVELETKWLEIKPVPGDGGEWKERHKIVNAFLNTRGGMLIPGVKEEGTVSARRYVLSGSKDHAEPNLKEFSHLFTDRKGVRQDLNNCFPPKELRAVFGEAFDERDKMAQEALGVVYRHYHFCKTRSVSPMQGAFALWYERSGPPGRDINQLGTFYRKVRKTFNKMEQVASFQRQRDRGATF